MYEYERKRKVIKPVPWGCDTESIQAALTVVRSRAKSLGLVMIFMKKRYSYSCSRGATPKDGPSAGIAMCTALVSTLTNVPVKPMLQMTGEITLRGQVLAIGGLKEKLLAAHRGGIKTVLILRKTKGSERYSR